MTMEMNLHILLPILLVTAKLVGVACRKMGVPAVVGEIAAGIILGPVLLGVLPAAGSDIAGYQVFEEFAQIGLCVLLFRIGLETDIHEFVRVWKSATSVAILGMIFPFLFGMAVCYALGWSLTVAAFVGATLTATSIGVTASVLEEINGLSSSEGRIILGAAVLDDVFGLILLAAMVALTGHGGSVIGPVSRSLVLAILFIAGGIFIGPWLVKGFMKLTRWANQPSVLLVMAFAYLLVMASTAHAIGLAMIIGAYAAGLAFGGHPEHEQLNRDLRPLIDLITPLFFILIGASIEFSGFSPLTNAGRSAWGLFLVMLTAAVAGKLLCPMLIRGNANKLAIGSGMMPRGEVGFVFAQVGLSVGVFKSNAYSVLTLVLVATTILGPLLLRLVWKNKPEIDKLHNKTIQNINT